MSTNTRSGWPCSLLGLFNFPCSGLIWSKNFHCVSVFINTKLKIVELPFQCVILKPADIGLKCSVVVCLRQLSPSPFMGFDTEAIGMFYLGFCSSWATFLKSCPRWFREMFPTQKLRSPTTLKKKLTLQTLFSFFGVVPILASKYCCVMTYGKRCFIKINYNTFYSRLDSFNVSYL